MKRLVSLLSLVILAGCIPADWSADPRTVFKEEAAYTAMDAAAEDILRKDYEAVLTSAHAAFRKMDGIEESLESFLSQMPDLESQNKELFYARTYPGVAPMEGALMREGLYDVSDGEMFILLTVVVTEEEGTCCKVNHFQFNDMNMPRGEKTLNLQGKSLTHHIVLGLLMFIPLFMVATAIFCGFSKKVTRKWLWIPFIIVGLWGFEFNWTTGGFQNEFVSTTSNGGVYISLFQFHLLGAAFTKAGLWSPWIITIGSPVGAVIFWLRYAFKKPVSLDTEF